MKLDGTNLRVLNRCLYKRQKPKDRDYDLAAYVPCDRGNPADRWAFEAFDAAGPAIQDGIYELIGPKVRGNPYHRTDHLIVSVVPPDSTLYLDEVGMSRSFDGLREYLSDRNIEGIVFHGRDGRLAKIKRRDFGLPWPTTVDDRPA